MFVIGDVVFDYGCNSKNGFMMNYSPFNFINIHFTIKLILIRIYYKLSKGIYQSKTYKFVKITITKSLFSKI